MIGNSCWYQKGKYLKFEIAIGGVCAAWGGGGGSERGFEDHVGRGRVFSSSVTL